MQTRSLLSFILRWLRYAYAVIGALAVVIVAFILVNGFVFTEARVDGISMEPTLQNGQYIPVCLLCARFETPKTATIVVVDYAGAQDIRFVKRIVATPGMTVTFQGKPLVLGSNQYFVEGDNRNNSTDSRSYGPVTRSQIVGFALGSYASAGQ